MVQLYVERESGNPRKYTDAFYDYLIEIGDISEGSAISNLLYWLSEDDVYRYAQVNYDIEWCYVEDEEEEEDEEVYE